MRPKLAPAEKLVFGFERFTELNRLKNSERNCIRIPSRSGSGKLRNTARLVAAEVGPSRAVFQKYPIG